MPFRLAALQAGLELEPGTSPPVLRRIPRLRAPGYAHLAGEADAQFDVVRNVLRFYAPASVHEVAAYLDAPVADIGAHWPQDVVEVAVTDGPATSHQQFVLADDAESLDGASGGAHGVVRSGRSTATCSCATRALLVADEARRKDLWRTLGRPGAVVADGEVIGTWRPRTSRGALTVTVEAWSKITKRDRSRLDEQAERLAAHRGVPLAAVSLTAAL